MHMLEIFIAIGLVVSACEGSSDPDHSQRLLWDNLRDYYYGDKGNSTDNDPDFTYGWDIDGS
ncbi:MAG: hypothetical protein GKS00_17555 [Alphaproteobacteria bacterium]|nr:hypothetical protein [Alphaproteobacteria bacterium]